MCKLKTKHTIEVQIDEMISRKKNLLEDVVTVDDHNVVKKIFTRDEIIQLLEDLRK